MKTSLYRASNLKSTIIIIIIIIIIQFFAQVLSECTEAVDTSLYH